ncbi:siderophore-interacting protein [uncultured Tateyamaria sp.]|uniref:siderophore-interacting protein n=1 Tax=uncultured Tateyamaria sp. TaxID=455651 RepID=UPI002605F5F7|nr:siderophore-interacting protein [uncultured Tateyamaria sp.]
MRKTTGRSSVRLLTVTKAWYLTPNMIRVVFAGPELDAFPEGRNGGNCKLMFPEMDEARDSFAARLLNGPTPVRRTFTVRNFDAETRELSIDFVAHGDEGQASRWASHAKAGSFLGFAGPSGPKVTHFDADWYLIAADPSAIPVAAATLEAMPRDAKGVAIFEITSEQDRQTIDMPQGIDVHWLLHPDPHTASTAQETLIRSLEWPTGRVQTCIAGESSVIRSLRAFLTQEKHLAREDIYISGYWKIGLVEDEHQRMKRADT